MNSKPSLEDFIKEHRAEFDDLDAPLRVRHRLFQKDQYVHHLWKWSAVAASGLLLVSIGYIFGTKLNTGNDVAGWKEYEETEQYYEARIQAKMDKIKTLAVSEEVMADIQILDDVYQQLRTQLMDDPDADTQLLLSAMIRHHQQKLEIMEKILSRVDKYKTNENEDHEM